MHRQTHRFTFCVRLPHIPAPTRDPVKVEMAVLVLVSGFGEEHRGEPSIPVHSSPVVFAIQAHSDDPVPECCFHGPMPGHDLPPQDVPQPGAIPLILYQLIVERLHGRVHVWASGSVAIVLLASQLEFPPSNNISDDPLRSVFVERVPDPCSTV